MTRILAALALALTAGLASPAMAMSHLDLPATYPLSRSYLDGATFRLPRSAGVAATQ